MAIQSCDPFTFSQDGLISCKTALSEGSFSVSYFAGHLFGIAMCDVLCKDNYMETSMQSLTIIFFFKRETAQLQKALTQHLVLAQLFRCTQYTLFTYNYY